jgi:hypothetical protein
MRWLNEDAVLRCGHMGIVRNKPSQHWVRIASKAVLVQNDPEGRDIDRCPFRNPAGLPPCRHTLKVVKGYSTFVRIAKRPVCLDSVVGITDGTPPGVVPYLVRSPGQDWVSGAA